MYIYHDKENNDYWAFNNLARLSDVTGLDHNWLLNQFSRKKIERIDDDIYVIVKVDLIKRKGSKK